MRTHYVLQPPQRYPGNCGSCSQSCAEVPRACCCASQAQGAVFLFDLEGMLVKGHRSCQRHTQPWRDSNTLESDAFSVLPPGITVLWFSSDRFGVIGMLPRCDPDPLRDTEPRRPCGVVVMSSPVQPKAFLCLQMYQKKRLVFD